MQTLHTGCRHAARVYSLAFDSSTSTLYVAGAFTFAGSKDVNRIAMWRDGNWKAIGPGLSSEAYALYLTNEFLYVGGMFSIAGQVRSFHCISGQ